MESLPESDQVRSAAAEVERMRTKVRWGAREIVATRDALFGMARMFQVLAEDFFATSRVFRDTEEAERWLSANRSRGDR